MTPRRRTVVLLAAALGLLAMLIDAPAALAGAGGGSSAFGGGGGGGGFGGGGFHGGGHGHGAGLYIVLQLLIHIAFLGHGLGLLAIVLVIGLAYAWTVLVPRFRAWWAANAREGRAARRRTAQRERKTELAAAEAAEEDPAFAPEAVRSAAGELWTEIQAAWDARNRSRLGELVAPGLMDEWERRLDDLDHRGWHNRVQPLEPPRVEYVGLSNTGSSPGGKRVVVRIEARLRDYVEDSAGRHVKRTGRATETVRTREFWTLTRTPAEDGWLLASIEQGAEGAHALADRLTPTPWSDDQSLRDESLLELTASETPGASVKPSDLVSVGMSQDARATAMDLSVADPRFSPDVLAVAARRAVSAWAEAVDGSNRGLLDIASVDAVSGLLHPGDPTAQTRLVVRAPSVLQIRVTGIDPAATPATMQLEVEIRGRRYIEDRSTSQVLSGEPNRDTNFTESWTFALTEDAQQPWQIVGVGRPMARA